jgi:hypothetical protein
MQVHLELLDELQTTPLYRHNIKRAVNNLIKGSSRLQLHILYKNMKTDNEHRGGIQRSQARSGGTYLLLTQTRLYNIGYRPTNNPTEE